MNELRALVRKHRAELLGDTFSASAASAFGAGTSGAGNEYAKATDDASLAAVEEIVEIGALDPDEIHLPGIYVNRIVLNTQPEKRIEQMTLKAEA